MTSPAKPFSTALADLVAEYRRRAHELRAEGHKQEYIALMLGVSQGTLSRWLRGAGYADLRRKEVA